MLKIINGGIETVVEDWPGRIGYLDNGMASSGAFDNVALGFANLLVGNPLGRSRHRDCRGLLRGRIRGRYRDQFYGDGHEAYGQRSAHPHVGGGCREQGGCHQSSLISASSDFRSYIGVAGGIDVPVYLGSKSTCLFGSYGGFEGRKLEEGDVLKFGKPAKALNQLKGRKMKAGAMPEYSREWVLRAIPGPNASPDYLTKEGMDFLFSNSFRVQHSSNRSAYRLAEAKDLAFARKDGGVAGSHPSNVLDHAYAIRGALNVCGNTPILLIADGPTLGGYMCALTVINAICGKSARARREGTISALPIAPRKRSHPRARESNSVEWLSEKSLA